jgi:crotonobetainyl-CoA:carnitine CoA-transferase CaiB-like acyl-CoA transferase
VADWQAFLERHGIPGGPLLSVVESLAHPQASARGMVQMLQHPSAGPLRVLGFPAILSQAELGPTAPPPRLGEHTSSVLGQELGLSLEEIEALRAEGAVG